MLTPLHLHQPNFPTSRSENALASIRFSAVLLRQPDVGSGAPGSRKLEEVIDWSANAARGGGVDAPVEQQQSSADRRDSNEMLGDASLRGGEEEDGVS